MAKIIPFPGSDTPGTPGRDKKRESGNGTPEAVPSRDGAHIISMGAKPDTPAEDSRILMEAAGLNPLGDAPDIPPEWAPEVHRSRWWRVGAVLVDELSKGPLRLDTQNNPPVMVMERLATAWGPPGSGTRIDLEIDLSRVFWMLEVRNLIHHGRKGISLAASAQHLEHSLWAVWAELFEYHQSGVEWESPHHPRLGSVLQGLIPRSLGLVRALGDMGPLPSDQLMELAMLNLDFPKALQDAEVSLPRGEEAFRNSGRPGLVEQEWMRLVIRDFAVPMGLMTVDGNDRFAETPLLQKL